MYPCCFQNLPAGISAVLFKRCLWGFSTRQLRLPFCKSVSNRWVEWRDGHKFWAEMSLPHFGDAARLGYPVICFIPQSCAHVYVFGWNGLMLLLFLARVFVCVDTHWRQSPWLSPGLDQLHSSNTLSSFEKKNNSWKHIKWSREINSVRPTLSDGWLVLFPVAFRDLGFNDLTELPPSIFGSLILLEELYILFCCCCCCCGDTFYFFAHPGPARCPGSINALEQFSFWIWPCNFSVEGVEIKAQVVVGNGAWDWAQPWLFDRFHLLLFSEISILTTWQSCRPESWTPWLC